MAYQQQTIIDTEPQGDFQNYQLPPETPSVVTNIVPVPTGTQVGYGDLRSMNYVKGRAGWALDAFGNLEANNGNFRGDITGATGTFSGTVAVGSLNIPDSTTANSFHTDSSGNSWWGANVASGYANANAYILATGAALFKNVQIGGSSLQYQATNNGVFSFGDGSDGAYTLSDQGTAPSGITKTDNTAGATIFRLDRDIYCTTFTVNATVTLKTNGYRIFVNDTLANSGTIDRKGNNGSNGTNGSGVTKGTGGGASSALADGYLKGSVAGTAGTDGTNGAVGSGSSLASSGTSAGANTTNSIGNSGVAGGQGGKGGFAAADPAPTAGTPGSGGTATASNVKLIANWHLATLLDISSSGATVKFDNSAGSSGGSGGTGGSVTGPGGAGNIGGGGGGGGSAGTPGGVLAIYAKNITNNGTITAVGGNGGAGGNGGNATWDGSNPTTIGGGGGGGGGGAGDGGQVILVYNMLTNTGTITAAAGSVGSGGSPGTDQVHGGAITAATSGSNGTTGVAGTVRQFQLSL